MMTTAGLLPAAVLAAAAMPVGAPAYAVNSCSEYQAFEFETPGYNTDLRVRLCLSHGTPTRGGYAQVSWENGGDNATDGQRKFDSLVVHYRLRNGDEIAAAGACDLTDRVNLDDSAVFMCQAVYHRSTARGAWLVDGWLTYNIDRDGAGEKRADLDPTRSAAT